MHNHSYIRILTIAIPLPYVIQPNSGPPYFTEPFKDIIMEVGQVYQFGFPDYADPDSSDKAIF